MRGEMSIESTIMEMAKAARTASMEIARCPSNKKNEVLLKIADKIEKLRPRQFIFRKRTKRIFPW
jgi:gamma-glutamyl phosphate reductase